MHGQTHSASQQHRSGTLLRRKCLQKRRQLCQRHRLAEQGEAFTRRPGRRLRPLRPAVAAAPSCCPHTEPQRSILSVAKHGVKRTPSGFGISSAWDGRCGDPRWGWAGVEPLPQVPRIHAPKPDQPQRHGDTHNRVEDDADCEHQPLILVHDSALLQHRRINHCPE